LFFRLDPAKALPASSQRERFTYEACEDCPGPLFSAGWVTCSPAPEVRNFCSQLPCKGRPGLKKHPPDPPRIFLFLNINENVNTVPLTSLSLFFLGTQSSRLVNWECDFGGTTKENTILGVASLTFSIPLFFTRAWNPPVAPAAFLGAVFLQPPDGNFLAWARQSFAQEAKRQKASLPSQIEWWAWWRAFFFAMNLEHAWFFKGK